MKNRYIKTIKKIKKKIKKGWKDCLFAIMLGLLGIAWVTLIKESHRLPVARRIREIVPVWIIILNIVICLISAILLIFEGSPYEMGAFIVFTLSFIFFSLTGERLPSFVIPMVGMIMLIILIVKKSIENNGRNKNQGK